MSETLIDLQSFSSRYKVSAKDGHVIWSLGVTTSSFQLQDFNFSRPHDARFLQSGGDFETITLLDNGGCEESKSSDVSSALIIDLDMSAVPWTAKVQKRWTRYGIPLSFFSISPPM